MKYLDKKFSVPAPGTDEYRDGWERIFGAPRCAAKGCEQPRADGRFCADHA